MHKLLLLQRAVARHVTDVGAVETEAEYVVTVPESKLGGDIRHHIRSGRCCQSQHRRVGKLPAQRYDLQIGWPKIIAPLRYAVRLIDHNKLHRQPRQFAHKTLALQLFG